MKLVISETSTSTWHYHIRRLEPGQSPKLGGGTELVAVCGHMVGWDTQIPVSQWGSKSHLPETWCVACERFLHAQGPYTET